MARYSVNFEVVSNCSIEIDVFDGDYADEIMEDLIEVLKNFKPQIIEMVQDKRAPEFITSHGHKFQMANCHNIRFSKSSYDELDNFISEGFN